MENVRIAIRDSTDSHNVAFFDNISGIRYRSANLQRFLAGSASILTIEYNSKDIDTIRTGCKLAFIYKERAYWLNIMDLSKKGYKVEITAYSLGLELNQEERGAHKPANAMSFAEYLAYYDPEHALELGVNEVADKRIKLEWTGIDTILARLFSIANSFDAELEFTVELNQDYSLKCQVLNVYKKGNLGSNRAANPVRVGRGLKVINYSDNLKELRTAVRATGKDGLTLDGLNKKVYDDDGNLLYYSNANTVYAPQSRDKYPSVGKKSNDNWIIKELGETEYSTQEDLWGYMLGELKKFCVPEITYDIEGAVDGDVGDTRTLIDDVHYDPPLYVQARISELTEDLITGKVTKSTLTNFERKYSQVASELLKQVEQLANDAAPYIIRLETNNGFNFKNGKGSSTVTARLEKYGKIVGASWQWIINNSVVSDKQSATINASQVTGTLNVVAVASVDGNEVAREYITFTNSDDGVGIKSIKRYYTTNDQAEGVTAGGQNWSTKPTTVTADKNYMWSYDVITYTNDTSLVTEPAVIGARGDDGLDADTTGITEALDKAKQELSALSANIEKVRDDSLAAVEEAKQQLATVANDLSKAKADLQNAVSAVDTKATNLQTDLTKAKQDLTNQASQLQAQASAQSELTKRVSSVEETANGTKTSVSELSKTVDSNTKNITSVTARTKTVEDDLTSTKTTLSQVQTTANSASQKTATLETGLSGLTAKFETLKIGSRNYFKNSKSRKYYIDSTETQDVRTFIDDEFWQNDTRFIKNYVRMSFDIAFNPALPSNFTTNVHFSASPWYNCGGITFKGGTTALQHFDLKFDLSGASNSYKTDNIFIRLNNTLPLNTAVSLENFNLYLSALVEDYNQNEADIESKVAEYKQTADQNYASLQTTVQNLDGTVKANKTTADQTAAGFKTRIESLETYKDGETTRANQYFELAKTETARQLTAERTAIAKDYVAKSTYTSDVTGIRNDLTATTTTANTTKTNLANYQASNDKAVANLQSNLQTANGNISSLQTKVEAVPGQITSAVSSVEGKIPTSLDSLNLMTGTRDWSTKTNKWHMGANWSTESDEYQGLKVHSTQKGYNGSHQNIFVKNGDIVTFSFFAKATNTLSKIKVSSRWPDSSVYQAPLAGVKESDEQITITSEWKRYSKTVHIISDGSLQFRTEYDGSTIPDGNTFYIAGLKLAKSALDTGYSENPTDAASDISKLNTALTQTANGLEQLSTQVTSQDNTITSHTNSINSLTTGLSAKVSQSDFNTLSGRVTTAENNITAKANELTSKITSIEGQIPSGEMNLVEYGRPADGYSPYNYAEYATHSFYYNSAYKMYIIKNTATSEKTFGMNRFKVERNTDYTLYFKGFNNSAITNMDVWFLKRVNGSTKDFDSAQILVSGRKLSVSKAEDVSVTFNTGNYDEGFIRFDNNGSTTAGTQADLYFGDVSVKKGKSNNGWSPSLAELASSQDLKTAQSEIKQTTDAITASVSGVQTAASNAQSTANTAVSKADAAQAGVNTLDSTTVKSASLTINTDGIVMKAGKSTTDVANAIGSYFSVNQNAINLFSDKIKIKGDMIVDGAITSTKIAAGAITADKIAANSINSSNIVSSGITANVIKGGVLQSLSNATNFELDTGKLFYNSNNTGVFRVEDGASTMGLKFSNTPITVNGTSRILSRVILGGDRRETSLDDGKWDQGGFTGIVAETINGVNSNQNEHADTLRVIGDNIYFTHSYDYDSSTGISAQGWKMETFSPFSSYPGNVVLKPYGVNYRQSDIITGDIRLDNGDGSGYWVRDCIRTLKRCFQHYLNGGTTSGAMNAIRDTLKDISGV